MYAEYVDVAYDVHLEELTVQMGVSDGHALADALEKAARNSWDPTPLRAVAEKIRAALPEDERPGLRIVMVPR